MSSPEFARGSIIPVIETTRTANVQEVVSSPARPADMELPLRSLELYLPTEPILINGQPYEVSVNQEQLIKATNTVADFDRTGTRDLYPHQVVINTTSGLTTARIDKDRQPKVTNPYEHEEVAPLTIIKDKDGTSVNVMLPSTIESISYSESGLTELVASQANQDLLIALGQNIQARRKFRFGLRMGGLALATGAGGGAGVIASNSTTEVLGYGGLGVVAGGMVGIVALLSSGRIRWGRDLENFDAWAIKKSRDYTKIHWLLEGIAKEDPIISLSAVQAETS